MHLEEDLKNAIDSMYRAHNILQRKENEAQNSRRKDRQKNFLTTAQGSQETVEVKDEAVKKPKKKKKTRPIKD